MPSIKKKVEENLTIPTLTNRQMTFAKYLCRWALLLTQKRARKAGYSSEKVAKTTASVGS